LSKDELGGTVRNHFEILRHPDFYNLALLSAEIHGIYDCYRSLQTHNSTLAPGYAMAINSPKGLTYELVNGTPTLFLAPMFNATVVALRRFLPEASKIIQASGQLKKILSPLKSQ
jgi:hypothetical protein